MAAYLNELCQISKGLYRIVSDVIGPEYMVKLRRQRWDIRDSFISCDTSLSLTCVTSGSIAEGFQFQSSDVDVMYIDKSIIVLSFKSCHMSNTTDFPTVLLMETEDVSPGFTLLRCLRYDYSNRTLYNSLVLRGNDVYVSSRIARDQMISGTSKIHGPCSSGVIEGIEYDEAYTLRCPFWPTQAKSFIYRSLRHGWPSVDVLTDICKDGCLLVPINSKQQTHNELIDLEWRISFSLAEKKLIYSMNHCQFLCYGLMKVFLNDILKLIPETGELLCSYFMKTAVFWKIMENACEWSPLNFMYKFWNVFRRVMKWVSIGYCPNFFIPHHNMFYGKIYGRQQRDLMLTLRTLYDEGYLCLLRCASLQEGLSIVINQPFLVNFLSTNENDYVSLTLDGAYRVYTVLSTSTVALSHENIHAIMRTLCNTATLISTSDIMTSAVKLRINYIVQQAALLLHSNHGVSNQTHTSNRLRYCFIKAGQSILRRTKTSFCFNSICLAVCSYRSGDYHKTVAIVNHIKRRLQRQTYMYTWNLNGDIIMRCRQQGMSYEAMVKTFVIDYYKYKPELSIEELRLESKCRQHHIGDDTLYIPPLVFLNLILVMSVTRLNDIYIRNQVLYELQTLVSYDDGYHIKDTNKAISWEILGICQQLCGDYHGAYQSYIEALNVQYNEFKSATIARINSLYSYMSY